MRDVLSVQGLYPSPWESGPTVAGPAPVAAASVENVARSEDSRPVVSDGARRAEMLCDESSMSRCVCVSGSDFNSETTVVDMYVGKEDAEGSVEEAAKVGSRTNANFLETGGHLPSQQLHGFLAEFSEFAKVNPVTCGAVSTGDVTMVSPADRGVKSGKSSVPARPGPEVHFPCPDQRSQESILEVPVGCDCVDFRLPVRQGARPIALNFDVGQADPGGEAPHVGLARDSRGATGSHVVKAAATHAVQQDPPHDASRAAAASFLSRLVEEGVAPWWEAASDVRVFDKPTMWPSFRPRRARVHQSVIAQIDGILASVLRVRLTRDVCCTDPRQAYCQLMGPLPFGSPASTECAIYHAATDEMPQVVEAVAAQRGYGLFVAQSFFGHGPPMSLTGETWLRTLRSKACSSEGMAFSMGHRPVCDADGRRYEPRVPFIAYFVSFGYKGLVRRKARRRESKFLVEVIDDEDIPRYVGSRPFCPTRPSPLPDMPSEAGDVCPRDAPSLSSGAFVEPVPTSSWKLPQVARWAAMFPIKETAQLALQAVSAEGIASQFAGDRSKCVRSANMVTSEEDITLLREVLLKEVAEGSVAGPFMQPPFPNPWCASQMRTCPLGYVPKDRYDLASRRIRPVAHFSVHGPSSINDLTWSPRLISAHLQARDIRNILVELGPRAQVRANDLKSAFRMNNIQKADMHLHVYELGPEEFYVGLKHPFGARVSEWAFQAVVAVQQWGLARTGVVPHGSDSVLAAYVDNTFLFSRRDDVTHDERGDLMEREMLLAGGKLHEFQRGPVLDALGWEFDLDAGTMACPADKHEWITGALDDWRIRVNAREPVAIKDIERLVGLMWWVSAVCPPIVSLITSISALKRRAPAARGAGVRFDGPAKAALRVLVSFWDRWSGNGKLFHDFSPRFGPEFVVKYDASTRWGCGGVLLPGGTCFSHKWSAAERLASLQGKPGGPLLQRESTTYLELLAAEYATVAFAAEIAGRRVVFEGDNEPANRDLSHSYSAAGDCASLLFDIMSLWIDLGVIGRPVHICTEHNAVADALSKDCFSQAIELALRGHLGLVPVPLVVRVCPSLPPSGFAQAVTRVAYSR